ncbi:MAG: hypothetical protein ACTSU0_08135 [Alphaproteobacteria bacterium]
MDHPQRLGFALAACLMLSVSTAARAHSFHVEMLFPAHSTTATADSFMREFLRAAAERDGHPGCACDGHLGGLDVTANATRADTAGAVSGTFLVIAGGPPGCGLVPDAASRTAIVINASQTAALPEAASYRAAYVRRYGKLPDDEALSGYLVARQIDALVRPLDGVDDIASLRAALPPVCK